MVEGIGLTMTLTDPTPTRCPHLGACVVEAGWEAPPDAPVVSQLAVP